MDIHSLSLSDSGVPAATGHAAAAKPAKAAPRVTMNGSASANGRPKSTDKAKGTGAKGAEKKDPAVLKREKQLAEEAEVCRL